MSILSDIVDAIGSPFGYGNVGSQIGNYLGSAFDSGTAIAAAKETTQTGNGFSWGDLLPSLLTGATTLAGGYYQNQYATEEEKRKANLEIEKLKLQAQYGLLGGKGGGGAGAAQQLERIKTLLATRQAGLQGKQKALEDLTVAVQNPLLGRR